MSDNRPKIEAKVEPRAEPRVESRAEVQGAELRKTEFEHLMLPHLSSAYNLALWLLRNPDDAEDVVQDSYLKAYRAFSQFSGDNCAAWLLKIVRNTCMTLLKRNSANKVVRLDALTPGLETQIYEQLLSDVRDQPESNAMQRADQAAVQKAIGELPMDYREVIILRELQDFDYRQIADITGVPIGTVMSRLSRARNRLSQLLARYESGEIECEL